MNKRMLVVLLSGLLLSAIVGCGGDGMTDVTGTVTIDGMPLAEGDIIFESPDKDATPQGTTIKDGEFKLRMGPGKKIVRINASEGDGKIDPLMQTEGRRSIIPAEFNTATTLKAEIKAGDKTPLSFAVKRIPK